MAIRESQTGCAYTTAHTENWPDLPLFHGHTMLLDGEGRHLQRRSFVGNFIADSARLSFAKSFGKLLLFRVGAEVHSGAQVAVARPFFFPRMGVKGHRKGGRATTRIFSIESVRCLYRVLFTHCSACTESARNTKVCGTILYCGNARGRAVPHGL